MPDYANGKIYRIVGNGLTYIGSTCCTLRQRLAKHVYNYRDFVNDQKGYISSFEIIKNGNYDIILIEDYPCERREQLLMKERYYIENMDCINRFIPIRDKIEKKELKKEYRKTDKVKQKDKEYYGINRELILKKQLEYTKNNKEIVKQIKKTYRENNKEILIEKNKEYYDKNKDEINKRRRLKVFLKSQLKLYNI